jgi:hypothetical protein
MDYRGDLSGGRGRRNIETVIECSLLDEYFAPYAETQIEALL